MDLLQTRISITTGFASLEEGTNLTHQFLTIKCGDLQVTSQPEKLDTPLRVASAEELGETLN